jgi:hypothetical protein
MIGLEGHFWGKYSSLSTGLKQYIDIMKWQAGIGPRMIMQNQRL